MKSSYYTFWSMILKILNNKLFLWVPYKVMCGLDHENEICWSENGILQLDIDNGCRFQKKKSS